MAGFFSRFWQSGKGAPSDTNPPRSLTHPSQLQQGDVINFNDSFALPEQVRGRSFEVSEVNGYEFEDEIVTEFLLQGESSTPLFLSVVDDDEDYLNLSVKILRADVEKLFDLDNFADVFDGDGHTVLNRIGEPDHLSRWTAPVYRQEEMAERGYYLRGDRRKTTTRHEGGEVFDYYLLVSDDREYSVEAEVYDGGETDVALSLRRPLSDITEMWPAGNNG